MSDDEWLDLWKFAKKHIEPASSRRLARAAWEWVTHGYQRAARGELTAAEYAKAESTVDRDGHVAAFAEKSFLGVPLPGERNRLIRAEIAQQQHDHARKMQAAIQVGAAAEDRRCAA
ncbi:MAG: hypothetical protein WA417_01245 [Stellaceae bacterium]